MSKTLDVNIIIDNGKARSSDERLFFSNETVLWLPEQIDMIGILVQLGVFPSRGQAKKNGWAEKKEIPDGFSEFEIGKFKHKLTILKAK